MCGEFEARRIHRQALSRMEPRAMDAERNDHRVALAGSAARVAVPKPVR